MYVCVCVYVGVCMLACMSTCVRVCVCTIIRMSKPGGCRPKSTCLYIRQTSIAHVITDTYHFRHSKNLLNPVICVCSIREYQSNAA